MSLTYIRRFDKGAYVLVIDTQTRPGERIVRREYKNGQVQQAQVKQPRQIPPRYKGQTKSSAKPIASRIDCVNLLEATDRSIALANCGTCGMKEVTVWECQLFGACAPVARGTLVQVAEHVNVRDCRKCAEYTSKATEYSKPLQQVQETVRRG